MRTWILASTICLTFAGTTVGEPLVFVGHTFPFSKTAETNQDLIVPGVAITRGTSGGLFNAVVEASFVHNVSPIGTAWAFKNNNPGKTLAASNWGALTFADWETSLGGQGNLGTNITDGTAVLHLVQQDIYLDIRFTAWGMGSGAGGSFSYERAEITSTADFDRDGDVDGQDFLTWQRGFGMAGPLQTHGDANFDGGVDGDDLELWQQAYAGPLAAVAAVPEPNGLVALWVAVGIVLLGCRRIPG